MTVNNFTDMFSIEDGGIFHQAEHASGYVCPRCNGSNIGRVFGPWAAGHHAKIQCLDCERWIKWEGKPKELGSKRSTKGHCNLIKQYSKGQCEICLRSEKILPSPQTLEVHHIIEVKDGGTDEHSNIQIVCTPCHKWIHHQRTYLGHYNPASQMGLSA